MKNTTSKKKVGNTRFSQFKFFVIYSLPLAVIIALFPFRDPIFLNNHYPYEAAFSGSTIMFKMGFLPVPAGIPAYSRPPLLSAIGLPRDLFIYQTCFQHKSFFEVNGKKVDSNAVTLDVRVKVGSQTTHLPPNSTLCLPPNENSYTEIFVGNAISDGNIAATLLEQNDRLPIKGRSEVVLKERPIYNKVAMFFGILFTFYPLYWAAIIAWASVHKYVHTKN